MGLLFMKNNEKEIIIKMINYIDKSLKYTKDYSFQDFCNDEKTQDATIFNISQIGELTRKLSEEFIKNNSTIEWKMIKGLRNRIVHDYDGINLENIWYIITNDLNILKKQLSEIKDKI